MADAPTAGGGAPTPARAAALGRLGAGWGRLQSVATDGAAR